MHMLLAGRDSTVVNVNSMRSVRRLAINRHAKIRRAAVLGGLVSGSIIYSSSMIEPGQPCVTMSGKALGFFERTWMK